MLWNTLLLPVAFLLWNSRSAATRNLPKNYPKCRRLDPNFGKCMVEATETMKPILIKGIPELKIDPIEPFEVPPVTLQQGSETINFKAILTNIIYHGFSNYTFTKYDIDFDTLLVHIEAEWNDVKLTGDYTAEGRVLILPVNGAGKFLASFNHGNMVYTQKLDLVKRKGREYLRMIGSEIDFHVDKPKMKLDGEFQGGKEFSEAAKRAFDENIDLLFEDMRPIIQNIFAKHFGEVGNKFLSKIPVDELFGPSA